MDFVLRTLEFYELLTEVNGETHFPDYGFVTFGGKGKVFRITLKLKF